MQSANPFILTFSKLGRFLLQFQEGASNDAPEMIGLNEVHFDAFRTLIEEEHLHNPWFTPIYIKHALRGLSTMLGNEVLLRWLSAYDLSPEHPGKVRTIGLVLAGNIPLV